MKKIKEFCVMGMCSIGVLLICGLESGLLFKVF